MQENSQENVEKKIPEEFQKIIKDFVGDILNTFPEYEPIISNWWSKDVTEESVRFLFDHCLSVFPERFMDILYQNTDIFLQESTVTTEFLPGISFKYLWNSDISEKTKTTIMKYLQLILLSIVGSIQTKEAFGNTAKLFENINEDEFKEKLQETLEKMQEMFESKVDGEEGDEKEKPDINLGDLPTANEIHRHITGMMDGKLGQLAREIAEETADEFNMDIGNMTDTNEVFQSLFKNPGKMMNLVKNVGDKLETRLKSGDIKESELYEEASELMKKMKNMPGMDNIQSLLEKFGGSIPGLGKNAKVDVNAMENQLKRNNKMTEMRERMKKNAEKKNMQKAVELAQEQLRSQQASQTAELSIDEILASLGPTINKEKENSVVKKKKNKNK
jgi:hypothetical protein